jgi:hypothetical protein
MTFSLERLAIEAPNRMRRLIAFWTSCTALLASVTDFPGICVRLCIRGHLESIGGVGAALRGPTIASRLEYTVVVLPSPIRPSEALEGYFEATDLQSAGLARCRLHKCVLHGSIRLSVRLHRPGPLRLIPLFSR